MLGLPVIQAVDLAGNGRMAVRFREARGSLNPPAPSSAMAGLASRRDADPPCLNNSPLRPRPDARVRSRGARTLRRKLLPPAVGFPRLAPRLVEPDDPSSGLGK